VLSRRWWTRIELEELKTLWAQVVAGLNRLQDRLEEPPPARLRTKVEREAAKLPGKGFDISKTHDAGYAPEAIEMFGATANVSTSSFEMSNIGTKEAVKRTERHRRNWPESEIRLTIFPSRSSFIFIVYAGLQTYVQARTSTANYFRSSRGPLGTKRSAPTSPRLCATRSVRACAPINGIHKSHFWLGLV
jgi:hypothetical protein